MSKNKKQTENVQDSIRGALWLINTNNNYINKFLKNIHKYFNMSYLNKGQLTTDQDTRKLGHMFIIPFPVLCKCRNQLKRTKTTKIISKDDIKKSKDDIKKEKTTLKEQRRH